MNSVKDHYENLLARHYSWMAGGLEENIERNFDFFRTRKVLPEPSGLALDLGAGCGFQSIALSKLGFSVVAVDSSETLLNELRAHSQGIQIKEGDLIDVIKQFDTDADLCVCMGDTVTHLESIAHVQVLFTDIYRGLVPRGLFILAYRDFTKELQGVDRFIPVRQDEERIFTCFLEYQERHVIVHDLLYTRSVDGWDFHKSTYNKLRLNPAWVEEQLTTAGFAINEMKNDNGLITLTAMKQEV